ncbi:MAG: subclass B3 metallo-beta-lactamase [Gemmatimonadales bacterium]|nr:subclass B3 metallo-beta-lactamase [Gemmatimonadales bacterium]
MHRIVPLLAATLIGSTSCQGASTPKPDVASPAPAQATTASAKVCAHDSSWTAPQAPFRIYGNTWHVGPRGLGVFLITAPTGHVLIDGGVPGGAPLIEANIRAIGIDPRDIKWILVSHAHCDHAGDVAQLAATTGAEVVAGTGDVLLLARGGHDDPQYGNRFLYPPVQVTRKVTDGEVLRLGDLALTAHLTPGHTKGNATWGWTSCEGGRCLQLVDIGSLSAPDYTLIGNPNHQDIVTDYGASFTKVAALRCDIALAPHPGMVDFWERVARRDRGEADALIDSTRCRVYAEYAKESFRQELAKQSTFRRKPVPSGGAARGRRDRPQRVLRPQVPAMNVKYFRDTDTALLEFSDAAVDETREISESVYVDLDKNGNLVSMTIEHAAALAHLPHVRVEEIDASAA